jgi:hypothetical protein
MAPGRQEPSTLGKNDTWPDALTSRWNFDGWRHGFRHTSLLWLWITPWIVPG